MSIELSGFEGIGVVHLLLSVHVLLEFKGVEQHGVEHGGIGKMIEESIEFRGG